jgi:hypothetical protein
MSRLLRKLAFWLLIMLSQTAYAQDRCNDVLAAGLFNTTQSVAQSEKDSAARAYYCATGYDEAKHNYQNSQSGSSGGGGGVSYGPFALHGDANQSSADSVSEEQYTLWKSQNCGDSATSDHQSDFQYFAQSQVAPKVAQAWTTCMTQRQGLSCWVDPHSEYVLLIVNFNVLGGVEGKIESSFVSNGRSTSNGASDGQIFSPGFAMVAGKRSVPLVRNKDGPMGGSFTMQWSGQTDQCDFHVPAVPAKPSPYEFKGLVQLAAIPRFGCRITSQPCTMEKAFEPGEGFDICRIDYRLTDTSQYRSLSNGFREMTRRKATVRFTIGPIPKGTERPAKDFYETWGFGPVKVSQIDARATLEQRVAARCNVEKEVWDAEHPADTTDTDAYGRPLEG